MTLIIVEQGTLRKLWIYKVENGFRTHDLAIADLLERAEKNERATEAAV